MSSFKAKIREYIYFTKLIQIYILLALLMAFRSIVHIRRSLHRYIYGEIDCTIGVLFSNISRKDADTNVLNCLKYFANFAFFHFGCEVSAIFFVENFYFWLLKTNIKYCWFWKELKIVKRYWRISDLSSHSSYNNWRSLWCDIGILCVISSPHIRVTH